MNALDIDSQDPERVIKDSRKIPANHIWEMFQK